MPGPVKGRLGLTSWAARSQAVSRVNHEDQWVIVILSLANYKMGGKTALLRYYGPGRGRLVR